MFRRFRIMILVLLLVSLTLGTLLDRFYITRWDVPLAVALYPINADGNIATDAYIAALTAADFTPLERFFADQAREYGLALENPLRVTLAAPLKSLPPKPPTQNPGVLKIMVWSLRLRWWAWVTPPKPPGPTPRVRLFLLFYDPATHEMLDHSTGLEKGKLGIVNLFAAKNAGGSNQVVIAHELLHTLSATDKYDLRNTLPRYPDGYAEPNARPRYPQRFAELMGGRVPLSSTQAQIPRSLAEVLIGPTTAAEIGWKKD